MQVIIEVVKQLELEHNSAMITFTETYILCRSIILKFLGLFPVKIEL